MKKYLVTIVAVALALINTGCAKKSDNKATITQYMTATISGNTFTASTVAAVTGTVGGANMITISGTSGTQEIDLSIIGYNNIPANFPMTFSGTGATLTQDGKTFLQQAYGEIDITTISGKTITGKFNFVATDSTSVTNGTFQATLP